MINKIILKSLIGRELTETEIRKIEWLNGWDQETSSAIAQIIKAAYQNGLREAQSNNKGANNMSLKSTGIVRKVDELGRVVIPMELRRTLGIGEKDPLEIYVDGERIMLKKYAPGCVLTGEQENLINFHGKLISKAAIKEMAIAAGII